MKKFIAIICSLSIIYCFTIFLMYEIRHSNPYLLQINKEDIDYNNVDYENLYQVSQGEISNVLSIQTNIEKKHYNLYEVYVSHKIAEKYYVGQYLANCKEEIFGCNKNKECNIRIVAIQEELDNVKITYICGDKILVEFDISSDYVNKITEENDMNICIGEQKFEYSIKSIGQQIDNNKFSLIVELYDNMALARPGATVNAELIVEKKIDALLVPISSITSNEVGEEYVLLYNNDDYEYCKVKTGINEGQMVEIISGLSEGDIILDNE